MRLLNPSPGELLDRLSILELKIEAAKKKDVSSVHFEAEKATLQDALRNWERGVVEDSLGDAELFGNKMDEINKHKNGLAAANALLWQAEDDVRDTPETEAFKLAGLCKRIATWNDSRAAHVRALDLCYGLEDGPEKLYTVKK